MADELIDVIDENNNVVGQEMKSVVHEKGLRHRVSAVLIKDAEGKYLIPTASEIKVEAGKLYHSSAGHVAAGESYKESSVREVWEECGLKICKDDLKLLGNFWMEKDYSTRKEKERFEVSEVVYKKEVGEIVLNEEQVEEKWFSLSELEEIYTKDVGRFSFPLKLSFEKILTNLI